MRELKIKQLSKSGEIIGVVSCFSAKINVLRAKTEDEILPYQRALTNSVGPDQFELEVDGRAVDFNSDVEKIGFAKPEELNITLREYLEKFSPDVSRDTLKAVSRDLELNKDLDTNLSELSDSKLKLVDMLKLSLSHSKIFVMYVPFEKIDSSLREPLSDYMCEVSDTQNHIIVITSLQYTPKNWVENEVINRIEVGQNRHKTIGFGSAPSELQAMLNEVRKENKEQESKQAKDSFLDVEKLPPIQKSNFKIFTPIIFLLICGISYYFSSDLLGKKEVEIVKDTKQLSTKEIANEVQEVTPKKPEYALNLLPMSVKRSIISTFNGTSESVSYREVKRKVRRAPKAKRQESAGESLLQSLKRTSNTGKNTKALNYGSSSSGGYRKPSTSSSSISEERRELLRQKFKEALARASRR